VLTSSESRKSIKSGRSKREGKAKKGSEYFSSTDRRTGELIQKKDPQQLPNFVEGGAATDGGPNSRAIAICFRNGSENSTRNLLDG
jgi:hypothetical protein